MVYRLGKKIRFYRLRRIRWERVTTSIGLLLVAGVFLVYVSSPNIPFSLALRPTKSKSRSIGRLSPGKIPQGRAAAFGSSKPAPKGTPKATTAAPAAAPITTKGCNMYPPEHSGLANSTVPELKKLAQYEQVCNGAVAQRSSFFVSTPSTTAQAQTSAQEVAAKLKAYGAAGIPPLVFMEPVDLDGNNLDLTSLANGAYDTVLDAYFQALQNAGISSSMMGMWVDIPEGNLPQWSTTDPTVFGGAVAKMAQAQKRHFPGSQASLMLDSESYAPGASWGSGSYASLVPYTQHIPAGLFDSFGLQGFPWAAPANNPSLGTLYDPSSYLRIDLAMQAARALGVSNIWFNTGTFNKMYAGTASETITNTPAQRQQMLDGVIALAKQTQAAGFSVAIHLFSQNKANLSEGTDWSYWATPGDSANTDVFSAFASEAATAHIPLWIFDSY